jgi:hypothetical protein
VRFKGRLAQGCKLSYLLLNPFAVIIHVLQQLLQLPDETFKSRLRILRLLAQDGEKPVSAFSAASVDCSIVVTIAFITRPSM